MSVTFTNERTVALYDSVTGIAFGEVFENADEADAFLNFYRNCVAGDIRHPAVYAGAHRLWTSHYRDVWEAWLNVHGTIDVPDFSWHKQP